MSCCGSSHGHSGHGHGGNCCPPPCPCCLTSGPGITVTGTGNPNDPFKVEVNCETLPEGCAGGGEAITVIDTPTVDLTLLGSELSAAAILDPGAGNLLSAEATGLRADVVVGCGVEGNGTPGSPLSANVASAPADWADVWDCSPAQSTLRCAPTTGELWTPPEHNSWREGLLTTALVPGDETINGPAALTRIPGAVPIEYTFGEGSIFSELCRRWSALMQVNGLAQVEITEGTRYTLFLEWERQEGANPPVPGDTHPVGGIPASVNLLPDPPAQAMYVQAASSMASGEREAGELFTLRAWPAIQVDSGSVTVTSWLMHGHVSMGTRSV